MHLLGQPLNMELAVTGVSQEKIDMIDLSSLRMFGNVIFIDTHSRIITPKEYVGITSYRRARIDCEMGKYIQQETGYYNSWAEEKKVFSQSLAEVEFNLGKEETLYCQFLSAHSSFKGTDLEKAHKFKETFKEANQEMIKMAPMSAFTPLELFTKTSWDNRKGVLPEGKDAELTPLGKFLIEPIEK